MQELALVRFITVYIALQCPCKGRVIPLRFHVCFMTQDGIGSFPEEEFSDHCFYKSFVLRHWLIGTVIGFSERRDTEAISRKQHLLMPASAHQNPIQRLSPSCNITGSFLQFVIPTQLPRTLVGWQAMKQ
uniref:Uncharacterized protein n=1 Tax=Rousettus aegyptiacus TaxID=9407 RepID=A0A7J8FK46_ROUAE|nr:hypothetical protein HJG63_011962 [Rousettus aegyptiacus]